MIDKMKPIKGYFKVDKIVDGEIVDTYEDKNTVMARIPQLYAGQASGKFKRDIDQYVIGCFALGTGGTRTDTLGNEVIKTVRDDRNMLFSEFDFWNTPTQITEGQPAVPDDKKLVHQVTFEVAPDGDNGLNPSFLQPWSRVNYGDNSVHTDWIPDPAVYRNTVPPVDDDHAIVGEVSLQQNVIEYNITVGQFAANADNDNAIPYTEAGLYLKLGADSALDENNEVIVGKPLGTLFSMKTFPAQWKNSTCSLKIQWKLFF